jgi:putative endonuclease
MEEIKNTVVYIIFSEKTSKYYTGKTTDFNRRLWQHNNGLNTSTKSGIPWINIWLSDILSSKDASELERKIKKRGAKRFLEDISEK